MEVVRNPNADYLDLPRADSLLRTLSSKKAANIFEKMAVAATEGMQEAGFAIYGKGSRLRISDPLIPDPEVSFPEFSPWQPEAVLQVGSFGEGYRSIDISPLVYEEAAQNPFGRRFGFDGIRDDVVLLAHTHPDSHTSASINRVMPSGADMHTWREHLKTNPGQIEGIMGASRRTINFFLMRAVANMAINETYEAMQPETVNQLHRALKLSNIVFANLRFDRQEQAFQPGSLEVLSEFLDQDRGN